MRDVAGNILSDEASEALAWQHVYLSEFGGHIDIVIEATTRSEARRHLGEDGGDADGDVEARVALDILRRLVDAVAEVRRGRAMGPDCVPVEAMQAGGLPYCRFLAHLVARASSRR